MWYTHAMPTTLEEAIQIIEQLQAENAALKQQLAELREQLAQAQQAQQKAYPKVKGSVPKRAPQPRPTRDPQHNRGRKRQDATHIEQPALDACPECGPTLVSGSVAHTHQLVDLPPPQPQPVKVVEHQVIECSCPHYAAGKAPTLDLTGQVIRQSRIRMRVAALVVYLRTVLRLTIWRIPEDLATVHGLQVSIGEITRLLHQVQKRLDGVVESITAQARTMMHMTRAGAGGIVKHILAGQFQGHLMRDFYGGYHIYPGQHQRCWVHLLCDPHDLRERQCGVRQCGSSMMLCKRGCNSIPLPVNRNGKRPMCDWWGCAMHWERYP